jgi:outer membrane receptor protein involved in Fe transport
MKLDFRQRLLASTLMVGASMLATPAYAQDTAAPDPTPSGPVEAQPTPATDATGAPTEGEREIVVTGTRIPSANLESAAPVTVVTSQDLKLQGTTRVEDLLNSLPSVGASQSSGLANGATGTAEVDLRYLGSKRTLALVNGRRLVPGDPNSTTQAADLNFIPSSVVKRVEVLTGGASSVYGADAVAGVVNFIMDTSFSGIRFDGQYSFYQHGNDDPFVANCVGVSASQLSCAGKTPGDPQHMSDILGARGYSAPTNSVVDGGTFDGTVSIGSDFADGKGHVLAYFGYRKVKPILQARRDYSACVLQNTGSGSPRCGGSATSAEGNVIVFDGGTSTIYNFGNGGEFINSTTLYNFAPLNYFQRPDERYIGGVFANYEISPAIKPYLEFMYMDDRTLAQIAPSGDFGNTLLVNCDNPLLSAEQLAVVCDDENLINGFLGNFPLATGASYNPNPGDPALVFANSVPGQPGYNKAFFQLLKRNVEGGPRIADLKHTSFRAVVGTKGDLGDVWSYDAYYQYGRTNYTQVYKNEFSTAKLNRALDVVNSVDTNGDGIFDSNPVCRSVLDGTDPNCIAYDVFNQNISPAAVAYLNTDGIITGQTSEMVANVNFTATLGDYGMKFPWANDGVGLNFGFEYRKEKLELNPDEEFQLGDLTGQGAPTLPVKGDFDVKEFFAETQIPIVQDNFIYDLTLGAGYRKSWYGLSNGRKYDTDTYKLSIEFAPIRDVRLRAALNRAVRAPNIQELFAPQFVGLDGSNDPCAKSDDDGNPLPITATDYGCLAQGLNIGQIITANPAGQYNGLLGGNPDLEPEKATTKTVGVIFQPRFLPRFALTVDYWTIDLKNAIQGFGADAIVNNCVNHSTATEVAPSCDLINRDPGGSLWLTSGGYVVDLPSNSGRIKTSGWDISSSYSHRLGGIGTLSASFLATILDKYKVNNGLPGGVYDCAGLYGPTCSGAAVASGAPMPKWRHKLRTTLQMANGFGLSLQWRRVGKVTAETLDDSETLIGGSNFEPGLHIKAQNYFDLSGQWSIGDHYNLRLGVQNIFDRNPPLVTGGNANVGGTNLCPAGACNGNTYPGTWDALGRYMYAGVTLDF